MYEQSSPNAPSAVVASAGTQGSTSSQQQQLQFAQEFWEEQIVTAEQFDSDFKNHPLPLARIKKVMKSDPEVKVPRNMVVFRWTPTKHTRAYWSNILALFLLSTDDISGGSDSLFKSL